jgi:ribosome-associated translation inhibitor RaiA
MNTKFSYKNAAEKDKVFLENYLDKKINRLKTLIPPADFAIAHLEIRTEKFTKKEAFKVEIFLALPKHSFLSMEDDHTLVEAFDLSLDKLIAQVRKFHQKVNNNL